jgi:malonate-semialdehyde dehydrogenase (acetylating) / methylmalonate-semialdehyde dehydrogenase
MAETTCPLFIAGEWRAADAPATEPVYNPSDGSVIARVPLSGADEVARAVAAAEAGLPEWAETPAVERARVMFRYQRLLEEHAEELARLVTREHGKTLAEARGSVQRGIEVVEYACGIPALLMGETLENVSPGIDGDTIRQPVGVCAGITPFNFPAMVPLWMFPIALACGNTFVLKPSEKVPLTAVRLVELLAEAGLPAGVLNLVHGGREAVDALLTHPGVRAVSFVGSTPVARHVYQTATAHGKRVQAAGGAKNTMVVLPDADADAAVASMMSSAFGCAGERCMAGSIAVGVGAAAEAVLPRLKAAADRLRVGPTDRDPAVEMGPVVTPAHRERIVGYIDAGLAAGAELTRDGRGLQVPAAPGGFYLGPTLFDRTDPGMSIVREEIFGPVLAVMRVDDLDTAIARINAGGYGNAAVLFTDSGRAARDFRHRVSCGMVGINVGVPAPMAFFPFSGWNGSFFGDLHVQGREGIAFYTRQKVTLSRW